MVQSLDTCPVCKKEEHDETLGGEKWIECTKCKQWGHVRCYGLDTIPDEEEIFHCPGCILQMASKFVTKLPPALTSLSPPTTISLSPPTTISPSPPVVHTTATTSSSSQTVVYTNTGAVSSGEKQPGTEILKDGDENEMAIINDLILQQEKLCALQERRLELAEKMSRKSSNMNVENWMRNNNDELCGRNATHVPEIQNQDRHTQAHGSRNTGTIKKTKLPEISRVHSNMESNDMITLLQTQMQLMCRSYLQDLPVFDGDVEFWPIFYAQYQSTTQQGGFDQAHNLCRLRKCLKGVALDAVKGLLALPDSLEDVIEVLQRRFGSMQVIVRRKLKNLMDLQAPNENKPSTVIQFHEFIRGLHATLRNAGAIDYLKSPQTLDAAVLKLPPNMSRSWMMHRKQVSGDVSLTQFILWFERYYDCAVILDNEQMIEAQTKKSSRVNIHNDSKEVVKQSKATSDRACEYCKASDHKIVDCPKFTKLPVRVRWSFVRKRRLCFLCLESKHNNKNCTKPVCNINNCKEQHHILLHKNKRAEPYESDDTTASHKTTKQFSATVNTNYDGVSRVHFRVLPVILFNPNNDKNILTWAFLDEGSSPTMMTASIASKLGVSGVKDELCTMWTDSTVKKDSNSQRVSIDISGVAQTKKFRLHNVRTVEELNLPVPDFSLSDLKAKYKHLNDIHIPQIPFTQPEILIGLEHPKLGIAYEIREGAWNEPVATKTRLGWTIHGKEYSRGGDSNYVCHVCECNDDRKLDDMVRQFFTTESFGVKVMERELASKEDERALSIMKKTTRNVGNRFETGLLWRSDSVTLPDSKSMAYRRLICFEQKLMRDGKLKDFVMEKMNDHFRKGYLRRLTNEEQIRLKYVRHWYLPIFTVSNLNKGGKVRIVFDAAAKCGGLSLNDCLLKGPDQLASLFGVLLKFREGKVAVSADIAEMFHRIKIIEQDQYCQLILWRNLKRDIEPETFVMSVMTFGSTSSPSSAQFVKNSNALEYSDEMPRAVDAIVKRHYVDDWLDSFSTVTEAIKIAKQVRHIHAMGGFEIRNWISNSDEVLQAMDVIPNSEQVSLDVSNDMNEEKILGLYWDTSADEFLFKVSFKRVNPLLISKDVIPTKREILKMIMSVYDPLGFVSIVTVFGKIFLQEIWRAGIAWDEKIPMDMVPSWNMWLDSLSEVERFRIPRCLLMNGIDGLELHVLCDASESAFSACTYLRSVHGDKFSSLLVAAKTKVAPQKALSIPRLELQACLLGSRLQASIRAALSVDVRNVFMWTDSKTALGWIRSCKRKFNAFVSHRIGEILDVTSVEQWRWIPSKLNVADDATRGLNSPNITSRWLYGPDFLIQDQSFWPQEVDRITHTDEEVHQVYVNVIKRPYYSNIQVSRFSKYERLLRSVAYLYRYMQNLKLNRYWSGMSKKEKIPLKELLKMVPALTNDELQHGEDILFRRIQNDSYSEEILAIQLKKALAKTSRIYTLHPQLDENGIVRLYNRLDPSPVIEDISVKRPILLDHNHEITALIVDWVHRKHHHRCKEAVVNVIRQSMWIPKLRVLVNRIINHCNFCKYLRAKPVIPKMAPLPPERLQSHLPAFSYTGIDFFGPIEVTVGRRHEKRWGMICTCMTSRAIHLELSSSLDTSSAVMCLRNFMNRRGRPIVVFSDNGTNLKGAEKELRLAVERLDMEKVKEETSDISPNCVKMKWLFIPPGAPHFGGIWERMIQTVKKVLYVILKSKAPKDETLRSAIIEVENIVNSRPLTYSSTDVESPESITPNLLLRGPVRDTIPLPGEFNCKKQWRISQALANSFWDRWLIEYLPLIANRTKWYDENKPLVLGQVVLVMDENLRRGEWRKGVVIKVFPGVDGRIRSAEVKLAKGTCIRPVAKLAVIKDEIVASSTCLV